MRKFLSIAGGFFVFLVVVIAGFIGYAAYQGRDLDASSKAYLQANLSPILATWSEQEFLKRASPELRRIIDEKPEQLDLLFKKLSGLGALKRLGDLTGDSNVSYTTGSGKVVTAAYTGKAEFENGKARITVRLIQHAGQWQLLFFNVNSPLFLR